MRKRLSIGIGIGIDSAGGGLTPAYKAIYDVFTTKPTSAVRNRQNAFVKRLVNAGIWDKLELFYYLAAHTNDSSEALINWANPLLYNSTLVSTPTFEALKGFTGASGKYIRSNYIPATHASRMSQNSISIGVYIREVIEKNVVKLPMGVYDSTPSATQIYILPSYSNSFNVALNDELGFNNTYKTNFAGFYGGSRNGASTAKAYINYKKYDINANSVGLSDRELYILCRNTNGTASGNFDKQVSMSFLGSYLDEDEIFELISAFNASLGDNAILGDNIGIIGDSISDNDLSYLFAYPSNAVSEGYVVTNYAASGSSITSHMNGQTAKLTGNVYDNIILALGTNDNNAGDMNALRTIVENNIIALKLENPKASIYYMNILPRWTSNTGATEVDKSNLRTMINQACLSQNITCWDTYSDPWIDAADTLDGLHPLAVGHVKIWDRIKTLI